MPKKSKERVNLNVDVHIDPKTAAIVLTSRDRRLKGKPFKLNVLSDSPSYRTLYELMANESVADFEQLFPPNRATVATYEQLIGSGDPRTNFNVGIMSQSRTFEFNLSGGTNPQAVTAPMSYIWGGPGSGKSVLERTIISYALGNRSIELCAVDLKKVEFQRFSWREKDRVAYTVQSTLEMLQELSDKIDERYEILEKVNANSFLETPMSAIYLIFDDMSSFDHILRNRDTEESEREQIREIGWLISRVTKLGRAAGIFGFFCDSGSSELITGETMANIGRRVLMGAPQSLNHSVAVLSAAPKFGAELLRIHGRGLVGTYTKQEIVQFYYLPEERVASYSSMG